MYVSTSGHESLNFLTFYRIPSCASSQARLVVVLLYGVPCVVWQGILRATEYDDIYEEAKPTEILHNSIIPNICSEVALSFDVQSNLKSPLPTKCNPRTRFSFSLI